MFGKYLEFILVHRSLSEDKLTKFLVNISTDREGLNNSFNKNLKFNIVSMHQVILMNKNI